MAISAMESMVRAFASSHPVDAARALESLDPGEAAAILRRLPARLAGPVTERLTPEAAGAVLTRIGADGTRELLAAVSSRQAASILQHLEEAMREATISSLDAERARGIRSLLEYPPDTAGGMMDPHITSIRIDLTVGEAIAALRRARRHTLYYLYVTVWNRPATWLNSLCRCSYSSIVFGVSSLKTSVYSLESFSISLAVATALSRRWIHWERVSGVNLSSLQPFQGKASPSSTTLQALESLRILSSSSRRPPWFRESKAP